MNFNIRLMEKVLRRMEIQMFIDKKVLQKNQIKNQQGMVTIPFLLVSMILIFLILSFLFLNMTLVHISITQYMSYSTARKFFLASDSQSDQQKSAEDHYKKLRDNLFSSTAYTGQSGDWFNIPAQIEAENIGGEAYSLYPQRANDQRERFYGVNLLFETRILKLKIPFLSQGDDKALNARVSSFLGREPSEEECKDFMKKKYEELAGKCPPEDCPNIKQAETFEPDNGC